MQNSVQKWHTHAGYSMAYRIGTNDRIPAEFSNFDFKILALPVCFVHDWNRSASFFICVNKLSRVHVVSFFCKIVSNIWRFTCYWKQTKAQTVQTSIDAFHVFVLFLAVYQNANSKYKESYKNWWIQIAINWLSLRPQCTPPKISSKFVVNFFQ